MSGAQLQLKEPRSSVITNGRRKVKSVYVDGSEMIEEFDVITDELLLRKVRTLLPTGAHTEWTVEVGTDDSQTRGFNPDLDLLRESSAAPQLSRKDTAEDICFRIRNLPYPKDVFAVTIDDASQQIVVRTSNKKYFKRIDLPDMKRANLRLDAANLSWDHKMNTLVITYKKHMSMRVIEAQEKKERASMQSARVSDDKQQQCAQQ